jgi:PAS domain S-box-containing protein
MSEPVGSGWKDDAPRRLQVGTILLVAVTYAAVAKLTSLTATLPGGVAPLFPSAGIALAAVLLLGRRAVPGIWLGSFSANQIIYWNTPPGYPSWPWTWMTAASIAAGAAAGAWLGAWLGRRVARNDEWFASARSALAVCIVASIGAAVASSVAGVFTLAIAGIVPLRAAPSAWLTWFLGDYFGCIVAAPLVLAWRRFRPAELRPARVGEALLLCGVLLLFGYAVFFRGWGLEYGVLPVLIWAAFRFGVRGTASAAALVALLATLGTIAGTGPFARATVNDALLALHAFLGVTVIAALLLAALLDERGRVTRDLLRTEEKARVSEERLRQAARHAVIGIFDHDHRTDSLYWSPEQRAFHAVGPTEEITLAKFLARVHPDDRERVEVLVRRAHDPSGDGLFEVEHRITCPDGQVRWIATRSQTLFADEAAGRRPVRTIGASIDVTSRKRAEQEREKLEVQLRQRQRLEAIGTLAGGIAHDFNNILTAILGNAEVSLLASPKGSVVADGLAEIRTASLRAQQLVARILTFSRKAESRPVTCELAPIVNEALDLLRAALPASIEVRRKVTAGSAVIDPTQVHQVMMNLVTNATHAMEGRKGVLDVGLETVTVTGPSSPNQPIEAGTYAVLTVSDTGAGIPADKLDRIFEPYFTTKEVGKGTGLGLSVVHGIVTAANGVIRVESKPERGATFRVFLPSARGPNQVDAVGPAGLPRGTEHVLVVDDEAMVLATMATSLEALGYQVTTRSRAEEALETFLDAPERFDVVVTDLCLPGMDGEALVDRLLLARADLPIIVSTGICADMVARRLAGRRVRSVLGKPVSLPSLARALRESLTARPG